ncbi:MAG: hypothetical protein JO196_15535, partial [Hyphomicrobiales bacterium]|nr:hypothetical protein [Hyphomicrobiales bacterium]
EREGLLAIAPGREDRRSKELSVTSAGVERLRAAIKGWSEAQSQFARAFGFERTQGLRSLLFEVSSTELPDISASRA